MSKLLNTEIKIFYDLAPIYSSKLISYYTYASYTSVILNYLLLPHVTFLVINVFAYVPPSSWNAFPFLSPTIQILTILQG